MLRKPRTNIASGTLTTSTNIPYCRRVTGPRVTLSRTTRLGYPLAAAAGALTALQSRVNGGLAEYLGSGISAALVNFTIGLALIALIVVLLPNARGGVRRVVTAIRRQVLPWWVLLGGVFGGFIIAIQATAVPVIGAALFSVGIVSGQTISSLFVDRLGIGSTTGISITPARITGAIGAGLAVVIAVSDRWIGQSSGFWLLIVMSCLAGVLVSMQQAVNGRVTIAAHSAPAATLGSFLLGTLTMIVLALVAGPLAGSTSPVNFSGPAWVYLGGVLGVTFVGIAAFTVPLLGVLSFALVVIAGQLFGAILLDLLWPATAQPITAAVIAGAVLAALAAFIGRRRSAAA